MSSWDYIQNLLDIIDKQNQIIRHQAEIMAMYGIEVEDGRQRNESIHTGAC